MLLLLLLQVYAFDDSNFTDSETWFSDTASPEPTEYDTSNAALIAGTVCGTLGVIVVIVIVIYWCCRRKYRGFEQI